MKIRYKNVFLPFLLVDENTKFVFFKREYVYCRYISYVISHFVSLIVTNNKKEFVFSKE